MSILDAWLSNNLLTEGGFLGRNPNLAGVTPIPVMVQDPSATVKEEYKLYKEWDAVAWIPRKVSPAIIQAAGALTLLVFVVCLFLKDFIFFVVYLISLGTIYVATKITPPTYHYKVTTEGIVAGEQKVYWRELENFSLKSEGESKLLLLKTKNGASLTIQLSPTINVGGFKPILLKYLRES